MSGQSTRTLNYKLVLLGDAAVGKSSSVERFVRNEFFEYQQPTIGAAFLTQTITLPEPHNVTIKFEIWDTAGQERYRSLAPMYYRGAAAALVVYDITNSESFTGAKSWIEELQRQGVGHSSSSGSGVNDIVIALAGNKVDLAESTGKRDVATEDAQQYATDHNLIFYETSAKTGVNIKELFVEIAKRLPKQQQIRRNQDIQDLSLLHNDQTSLRDRCCS